ncbi:MAG TPA: hypothetical protein VIF37_12970 [Methylobacter sp.]|jgi:hypothetical protein
MNRQVAEQPASVGSATQQINSKYAAYGRAVADRQRWNNPPMFIFVCVGGDAYESTQNHNTDRDSSAMVLIPNEAPKALIWPVAGCPVVIEWDKSVPEKLIIELVKCLLRALAVSVTVWPTWEDSNSPAGYYENGKWVQTREMIRTYYPKAVSNVA